MALPNDESAERRRLVTEAIAGRRVCTHRAGYCFGLMLGMLLGLGLGMELELGLGLTNWLTLGRW